MVRATADIPPGKAGWTVGRIGSVPIYNPSDRQTIPAAALMAIRKVKGVWCLYVVSD